MSTDTVSKDGTDGLETVAKVDSRLGDMSRLSIIDRPLSIGTEVCLRSQAESEIRKVRKDAEELLAAKDEAHQKLINVFVKYWQEKLDTLRAENATLTARVKELEAEFDQATGVIEDRSSEYKALEAKLTAAEEVAQLVIQAEEDKSGDPNFYILMMQTAYDKARAVLGGKP